LGPTPSQLKNNHNKAFISWENRWRKRCVKTTPKKIQTNRIISWRQTDRRTERWTDTIRRKNQAKVPPSALRPATIFFEENFKIIFNNYRNDQVISKPSNEVWRKFSSE